VGPLAVVAFACTVPVTMWERSVLSESLAASGLALTLAATLQLARGVTVPRVVAVLAAAALWLITRDSHAAVVLIAAVAVGVGLVVGEWRARGVAQHGRSALAVWMATHPAYVVTEPLRNPGRTFNNAEATAASTLPAISASCRW
jgi:hypothetical protein